MTPLPRFYLNHALKFHDFSGDKSNNYCGFGLKTIQAIDKGDMVFRQSVEMGLVSNMISSDLVDDEEYSKSGKNDPD